MNVLVIAVHGDDEVLGCAGTLAKLAKQGHKVYRCIVTTPTFPDWTKGYISKRKTEIAKSSKTLGIEDTYQLNIPAANVDIIEHRVLNKYIRQIVEKTTPNIVFLPYWNDLHFEHKRVFEAAMVALRDAGCSIYCCEILSETGVDFVPDTFSDITDTLVVKLMAMTDYGSELREFPHPRSLTCIKDLAELRGSVIGVKAAEAFKSIRVVI